MKFNILHDIYNVGFEINEEYYNATMNRMSAYAIPKRLF